ncbi:hypothetical protein [Desulfocurvus vexinensis]|uniref:hypothetical protein n=1 Tax=Desulfocurvus vexinensis TaxID=399548 RepID=UPI0004B95A0A|nr:hypothetical protein [Desulfocurvus vexinensis]
MYQSSIRSRLYFDRKDHQLLGIVSDVLRHREGRDLKRLLAPIMHPRGIKEMAATKGLRIAYAVASLFRSLERGQADERLRSLRALRDETLHSSHSHLRMNTARVLMQIMKELVREKDELRRLQLARDFRKTATGKPRVVATQLRRYHLVEMPEAWNQVSFDDHVHDANTKGRKSATHLIMDAWIKGIRQLTVIYYNHVPPEVARELLEAGAITDIRVRVGIEFCAPLRGRFVRFIWTPRGIADPAEFLDFLELPDTAQLMAEGREVSQYQQRYVLAALDEFNARHLPAINAEFGLHMAPPTREALAAMVGSGEASLHHLAKLIHDQLYPLLAARTQELRAACALGPEERRAAEERVRRMNALDIEALIAGYLCPDCNPELHNPYVPGQDEDTPQLLRLPPAVLLARLAGLHSGHTITLNLAHLRAADVLELLYDCGGLITHLEIFNYKDTAYGRSTDNKRIIELQSALNSGNAVRLKKAIVTAIEELGDAPAQADQRAKLLRVLGGMASLRAAYAKTRLSSRIGTDSTGSSALVPGMGLVVRDTLPRKAQRSLEQVLPDHAAVPVRVRVLRRATYLPEDDDSWTWRLKERLARAVPLLTSWAYHRRVDWVVDGYDSSTPEKSNICLLGGFRPEAGNGLHLDCDAPPPAPPKRPALRYMNSSVSNGLKILLGFIPAFLTFALTKDWWVLAYLGAFLWFGITGVRNVIQSVLGSGGVQRSPLMRWTEYVSWDRLADSLMYTGFSVPLLDWLVKSLLLDQGLGVNAHTGPVLLYSVMGLVNGLYIMSHNLFRGLPRSAAFGNLFRTVLSIPLAVGFNAAIGAALAQAGVPDVDGELQKWAAVISKLASDCVAAVIEGLADRRANMRLRFFDYRGKVRQLFDTYASLELRHPTQDVARLLESPKRLVTELGVESRELLSMVIVNALDLMYFWFYQPRARTVLMLLLREMTREERRVFLLSQMVLQREREISQMFLDGLVGRNFAKALAFYLDRYQHYLEDLQELAIQAGPLGEIRTGVTGAAGDEPEADAAPSTEAPPPSQAPGQGPARPGDGF